MADENAADCIKQNLLALAPKVISVAEKRNLASKDALELLSSCHPSDDNDTDGNITDGMMSRIIHTFSEIHPFNDVIGSKVTKVFVACFTVWSILTEHSFSIYRGQGLFCIMPAAAPIRKEVEEFGSPPVILISGKIYNNVVIT